MTISLIWFFVDQLQENDNLSRNFNFTRREENCFDVQIMSATWSSSKLFSLINWAWSIFDGIQWIPFIFKHLSCSLWVTIQKIVFILLTVNEVSCLKERFLVTFLSFVSLLSLEHDWEALILSIPRSRKVRIWTNISSDKESKLSPWMENNDMSVWKSNKRVRRNCQLWKMKQITLVLWTIYWLLETFINDCDNS